MLENRMLEAEVKQKKMMNQFIVLKMKVANMEQQKDAFVEQIQKLNDGQKKCMEKYEELEKELARKYICIGQFAQLLTRIDAMEAQINEPKQMHNEVLSTTPVDKFILEDPSSTNPHGMRIHLAQLTGKKSTLDVLPTDTVAEIKAKIERTEGIEICQQRLVFNGKQLDDHCTLKDYNVKNGDIMHIVLRLCGC